MADTIETNYKRLICYKEMEENDRKNFDQLANEYGSILNKGPKQGITVYTSHDFDRHCFDLYRIISMYLLCKQGIAQLNKEELYLLNLSVLLHDISMCKGGYDGKNSTFFKREIHSLQSAQWIRHEHSLQDSLLYRVGLTSSQVEIICKICQAHSTLRDRDTPSGLFDPNLEYKCDGHTESVRIKALAGILRIADELDATSNRLVKADEMDVLVAENVDDNRPEVKKFIEQNKESLKHYRRLRLIINLERVDNDVTAIALKLDANEVSKRLEEGDEDNLVDDLQTIRKKIQTELDDLCREVLNQTAADAAYLTKLKTVVWSSKDSELIERLFPEEKAGNPIDLLSSNTNDTHNVPNVGESKVGSTDAPTHKSRESGGDGEISVPASDNKDKNVELLDDVLSQQIKRHVLSHHLFSIGHYQLNTTHCARDWIDTTELLNHSSLANDIINTFSAHISKHFGAETFTIVGLDLLGATTAAQIGFMLQMPFTYVIPAHQYSRVDPHEIRVPGIPDEHKIVLVTDSIVTGLTVSQIINENNWENRLLSVYTVFYRKPKFQNKFKPICFPCMIHALNTDFPMEIALVADCPYGNGTENCQAANKKL